MTWLAAFAGIVLFAAVASDAFEVMLLPRRVRRQLRPVRLFFQVSWSFWVAGALRIKRGKRRDAFLSLYGPSSMVLLLTLWAVGLIISFGLVQWGVRGAQPASLLTTLYFSGATFFTVGYGDVLPLSPLGKGLAVIEAGSGLAFIAATIGYLPVLYQLFSRREARIIQLDARAGSPPSAAALLSKHSEFDAMADLSALLKDWEQWCAEIIESHLSYPMLSYYRSQHDNQSWLAGLAAILDSCALLLTGLRGVRTFQASMTFAMGRLAAVELCRVFHLRVAASTRERLIAPDFERLRDQLADSGLNLSEPDAAEQKLAILRSTYEPFLRALSEHFLLSLPPWRREQESGNWQISAGGATARQMVESTPAKPD